MRAAAASAGAPAAELAPAVVAPGGRWAPRLGPGHANPGGDGCTLEEHRRRLAQEEDSELGAGSEPLLRSAAWTRDEVRYRSSTWAGAHEATRCLTTQPADRFCSQNGTYEPHGRPRHGAGEWVVFDLQREESIAKVRLVNYWSCNDSWSFKDLTIETAPALGGPFTPVAAFGGLPRCSESKAVDLYLEGEEPSPPGFAWPGAGRFWRVRCTATHGGGAFGIYGVDFWRVGPGAVPAAEAPLGGGGGAFAADASAVAVAVAPPAVPAAGADGGGSSSSSSDDDDGPIP